MEKWIYELILSVITVAGTIIALIQTRQQMRLSNKQALFEKRLNTYMFVKGLMVLCNSNKAHFREYRDDVCLSSNTIIFCFLTNNSCLKELSDTIKNSSDDNYRVELLKKLEEIKSTATRIELIFRGKKRFFCSEFVSDYGEVLWRMYQYQIVCDKIEERHKSRIELENLCGIYREPNYRKDVYDAMNKLVESYYKLEKVENKIRKQIVLK